MPLDLSRIQALCFDVDGTLSDTDDQFVQRLSGWLQPFRLLFPSRDVRPFARKVVMRTESPGNLLMHIPDRLGFDDELAAISDALYRRGLGNSPHPFLLIPGVRQMLELLKEHYPMSLVTVRGERTARAFLNQFDLGPYFSTIVSGQSCPHTKPYPDPILYAAKSMGVAPENCLMIGDTTVDIQSGKAAGAQTVGVLCGFGEENELRRAGADVILSVTTHLTSLLNL